MRRYVRPPQPTPPPRTPGPAEAFNSRLVQLRSHNIWAPDRVASIRRQAQDVYESWDGLAARSRSVALRTLSARVVQASRTGTLGPINHLALATDLTQRSLKPIPIDPISARLEIEVIGRSWGSLITDAFLAQGRVPDYFYAVAGANGLAERTSLVALCSGLLCSDPTVRLAASMLAAQDRTHLDRNIVMVALTEPGPARFEHNDELTRTDPLLGAERLGLMVAATERPEQLAVREMLRLHVDAMTEEDEPGTEAQYVEAVLRVEGGKERLRRRLTNGALPHAYVQAILNLQSSRSPIVAAGARQLANDLLLS